MLVMRKTTKVTAETPRSIGAATSPSAAQPAIDGNSAADQPALEEQPPFQFKLPKETTKKSEFLIKHIRENLQKDNTSMVNVLRTWLSDNAASDNME
jgi:flagellar biosynthesis/type III secretory pathway M-ring protein FliF/YscJ